MDIKETNNPEEVLDILNGIDPSQVTTSYSGKRGCMCGCLGTYKEGPKAAKAKISHLKRLLNSGEEVEAFEALGGEFGVMQYGDKRINAIYLRADS